VAAGLAGGAPGLVVVRAGTERPLSTETTRGYPAVSLGALASALGYSWSADGLELHGERVEFRSGSPFFEAGGRLHHLANPPYRSEGSLMLPVQWASEWLPAALPGEWRFRAGRLEAIATSARAAEPPPTRPRERWVVVLDAGHGGVDPGAVGTRGTREKDVALRVARALAEILRENPRRIPRSRS
jgi:N-acetylmuramoyl-L-alanine amidase